MTSRFAHFGLLAALMLGSAARAEPPAPASNASAPSSKSLFGALLGEAPAAGEKDGEDRIDPDRPHFPEASTAVGKGRVVLESGYTMTRTGGAYLAQSAPESLLRVGVWSDWFELRVGENYLSERRSAGGITTTSSGLQDLYLGTKFALTEQKGLLPAIALIPQMTVPTGAGPQTAGRALFGLNADFSWDVVKDRFGIELLIANNQIKDELGGIQHQLATGLTGVFQINHSFELFAEWDAYYLSGGLASTSPQHYAVGGLVYFVTPDLALDARIGTGLNSHSNHLLAGVGLSLRR